MTENEKSYSYRPFVKKLYWTILSLLFLAELIVIRVNIFEIMQEDWLGAIIKILVVSTVILSILVRVWVFIRPRVLSIYLLKEDGIEIHFKKKVKFFKFDQITNFRVTKLPVRFAGGFVLQLNTGQKFMISSLLEGCGELLEAVHVHRKDLIDETKYKKLTDDLKWLPLSWTRLQRKIQAWPIWSAKLLALPFVLSFWVNSMFSNLKFTSALIISFSLCLTVHSLLHLLEHMIFVKVAEKKNLTDLDPDIEKKFLWTFIGTYVTICLILVYGLGAIESYFH